MPQSRRARKRWAACKLCRAALNIGSKIRYAGGMNKIPPLSDKITGAPADPLGAAGALGTAATAAPANGGADGAPDKKLAPVIDVGLENFAAEVLAPSQQGVLVLLDAWAQWCEPCKQLTPMLEELARESQGRVRLAKVDIDQESALAQQMQVRSVPTVLAVKNGKIVDGFVGALPKDEIKTFLAKHVEALPAEKRAQALEKAKAAFAEAKWEEAQNHFLEILRQAPRDPDALGGLAQCYLQQKDAAQAKEVLALVEAKHKDHSEVAAARAQLELAQAEPAPESLRALEEKVQADPQAHDARYQLALACHQAGRRAQAIDHLLHLAQAAPQWQDGAARAQLLKLFAAYGPADEAVKDGRRRLSRLLFR